MRHLQQEIRCFFLIKFTQIWSQIGACVVCFSSNWMVPSLFWFPVSVGLMQWALCLSIPIPDSGPAAWFPFLLWPLRVRPCEEQAERHSGWQWQASHVRSQGFPVSPRVSLLMIGSVPGGGFAVTVNVASFLFCQRGTELLLNSVSPLGHRTTLISSESSDCCVSELHCQAEISSIWTGCGPDVFCSVPPHFCGWCRGFLLVVLHGDCVIYLQFASVVAWPHSVWDPWMSLCRSMAFLCAVRVYYPIGVQSPLRVFLLVYYIFVYICTASS